MQNEKRTDAGYAVAFSAIITSRACKQQVKPWLLSPMRNFGNKVSGNEQVVEKNYDQ